jgi:hypothetical protein
VHNINAYGEDLSSDLGPETDYPDWGILWFSSVPTGKYHDR